VNDGEADSPMATVHINIVPANDPPSISGIPDQAIRKNASTGALSLRVADVDNPAESLVVSVNSSNAPLLPTERIALQGAGEARTISLSPAANATGSVIITLRVSDGTAFAETSFHLLVTNTPPDAADDDVYSAAGPIHIPFATLLANDLDADGEVLNISLAAQPTHGNVQAGGTEFVYTPAAQFTGNDQFAYAVTDGSGESDTTFVRVHVLSAPAISSITATPGGAVTLSITGSPGGKYRVQTSSDARSWDTAGEGTADMEGKAEFHDAENGSRLKFYRVEWF
jgi:hypothetical protein